MVAIVRTDSESKNFRDLVVLLDAELHIRDGEEHAFYAQFNKIDGLGLLGVIVAYVDDIAVGCGAFKRHSDDVAEIKRMFVRPENRGLRIATQILSELERWAAEKDFSECVLETGFKQPEAVALYRRSGYVVIPNYGQYADVKNSLCMKKTLG